MTNKKNILILLLLLVVTVGCQQKETNFSNDNFKKEFKFLIDNSEIQNNFSIKRFKNGSWVYLKIIDSSCQICAIDIDEIGNFNHKYFTEKNIIPIVILYNDVDLYVEEVIKKKKYNFPIYHIEKDMYEKFITEKDFNISVIGRSILLNEDRFILFKGNPFTNREDLVRLSSIVHKK